MVNLKHASLCLLLLGTPAVENLVESRLQTVISAGTSYAQMAEQKVSFEQARDDPGLRQEYLTQMQRKYMDGIAEMIYDPDYKRWVAYMETELRKVEKSEEIISRPRNARAEALQRSYAETAATFWMAGRRQPVPIFVNDNIFDVGIVKDDEEAVNVLVDHEGSHAHDVYEGLKTDIMGTATIDSSLAWKRVINLDDWSIATEYKAYCQQLRQLRKKSIDNTQLWETTAAAYQLFKDKLGESIINAHDKSLKRILQQVYNTYDNR